MRFVFLTLLTTAFIFSKSQLFFMPYEQVAGISALKNALASARHQIEISIYSFTNKEIAKVLRDRARSGVKIYIIYDEESNIKNHYSTIGYLASLKNIQVCVLRGRPSKHNYHGIMHQKLAIIDHQMVLFGSANWSKNAFENNYEILFQTDDKEVVSKAVDGFKMMLKECRSY